MLIHTQDIFHKIAFDEMGAPCLIMDFALKVTIPALVKSLLEMQHDISTPANANQKNPSHLLPVWLDRCIKFK